MIKDDIDFSIAIDILNRKIANLNMKIVKNPNNSELKDELKNLLNMKNEVSKGNSELIKEIVNKAKN